MDRREDLSVGVVPDWQIQRDIKIEPFADAKPPPGVLSYRVSSYGYDVRVGGRFKIFTNARCAVVDPKNFDPASFLDLVCRLLLEKKKTLPRSSPGRALCRL